MNYTQLDTWNCFSRATYQMRSLGEKHVKIITYVTMATEADLKHLHNLSITLQSLFAAQIAFTKKLSRVRIGDTVLVTNREGEKKKYIVTKLEWFYLPDHHVFLDDIDLGVVDNWRIHYKLDNGEEQEWLIEDFESSFLYFSIVDKIPPNHVQVLPLVPKSICPESYIDSDWDENHNLDSEEAIKAFKEGYLPGEFFDKDCCEKHHLRYYGPECFL